MLPTDFIYHASTNGQVLPQLDPFHSVPFGDWRDGAYLSDSYEESLIWGASSQYLQNDPVLNIYDVDSRLNNLNGYIIDPYSDEDLTIWAASVAMPRRDRMRLNKPRQIPDSVLDTVISNIESAWVIYDIENFIHNQHWIISRRADDGLWRITIDYFSNHLSIEGLRHAYEKCAFGNEIVLRTYEATNCLTLVQSDSYCKADYNGQYNQISENKVSEYNNGIIPIYHYGTHCYDILSAAQGR